MWPERSHFEAMHLWLKDIATIQPMSSRPWNSSPVRLVPSSLSSELVYCEMVTSLSGLCYCAPMEPPPSAQLSPWKVYQDTNKCCLSVSAPCGAEILWGGSQRTPFSLSCCDEAETSEVSESFPWWVLSLECDPVLSWRPFLWMEPTYIFLTWSTLNQIVT